MSKQTFAVRQELKSLEFGMLLHHIVPKGVYEAPTITPDSVSGEVSVSGGVFLFYDTDATKSYAVRVEDVSLTISNLNVGDYLMISYTYSAVSPAEPMLSGSPNPDSSDSTIRLGRLVSTGSALVFDASSMEQMSLGHGMPESLVEAIAYCSQEQSPVSFASRFNGQVITNSGLVSPTAATAADLPGLDKTKAQYLYIDRNGSLKCADSIVPRFGKFVIAEKGENQDFAVNYFPKRAEIGTWSIEAEVPQSIVDLTTTEEQAIYNEAIVKTKTDTGTTADVASLTALLERAVCHIGELERKVRDLTERLEYLEDVKTYFAAQVTIPTAVQLEQTPTADKVEIKNVEITSDGTVKIDGAVEVDPNTSSFGTPANPIHNLYVSTALYADQLFVTE